MKLSLIIPNYNGEKLLLKNLPQVIKAAKNAEIIVVDDASTDDSIKVLSKFRKRIVSIRSKKNKGFASSCNLGVKYTNAEIVVLLNSDVSPQKDFLEYLLPHFQNQDVFAVGCQEIIGQDTRGKSIAKFKNGFLRHQDSKDRKPGITLWAFGAAAAFDRDKWLKLGGMDSLYRPAYWEDIDICWRAWKRGWLVLFEPKSKVNHQPESTNLKVFGKAKMKTISYKNQFLFIWKNITEKKYISEHLLWLPIHLVRSSLTGNGSMLIGFFRALLQLPEVIIKRRRVKKTSKFNDQEIISLFNKSSE